MQLTGIIADLYRQKTVLERAIADLESINRPTTAKRRGRKSMDAEERKQVSERMRKYWASRRKAKGAAQ